MKKLMMALVVLLSLNSQALTFDSDVLAAIQSQMVADLVFMS